MKRSNQYLTIDEKIDLIKERIYQAMFDEFDSNHTEEEIEAMDEEDTYFDNAYNQVIWVKEFEDHTFAEISNMDYEDIIAIHNDIYSDTLTLQDIETAKLYWENLNVKREK